MAAIKKYKVSIWQQGSSHMRCKRAICRKSQAKWYVALYGVVWYHQRSMVAIWNTREPYDRKAAAIWDARWPYVEWAGALSCQVGLVSSTSLTSLCTAVHFLSITYAAEPRYLCTSYTLLHCLFCITLPKQPPFSVYHSIICPACRGSSTFHKLLPQ